MCLEEKEAEFPIFSRTGGFEDVHQNDRRFLVVNRYRMKHFLIRKTAELTPLKRFWFGCLVRYQRQAECGTRRC